MTAEILGAAFILGASAYVCVERYCAMREYIHTRSDKYK